MDAATLAAAKAYANKRLNWRGAWAATTAYAVNDLVTYNGGLYRSPTVFTSGASFVKANWVELLPQSGAYALPKANTMVLFGDSISQRSAPLDQTSSPGGVTSNDRVLPSYGYFPWAQIELGQPFNVLNYAGVAGNTTTQMLVRMATDVLAYRPSHCIVYGGINDLGVTDTSDNLTAALVANLTSIYSQLDAIGSQVIGCTLTPAETRTAAQEQARLRVNDWLRRQAVVRPNFWLCDWAPAVTNPLVKVGTVVPAALWASGYSNDGLHPNTVAARRMGRVMVRLFRKKGYAIGDGGLPSVMNTEDVWALNSNPMMLTGGTSVTGIASTTPGTGGTGTTPDGWNASRSGGTTTFVSSIVARADGYANGNWWQLAVTGDGSNGVTADQGVASGFSAGDQVYAEAAVQADAFSSMSHMRVGFVVQDSSFRQIASSFTGPYTITDTGPEGGPYTATYPLEFQLVATDTTDPSFFVMRSPTITLPASPFRLRPTLFILGTGTVRISQFRIRKLLAATTA